MWKWLMGLWDDSKWNSKNKNFSMRPIKKICIFINFASKCLPVDWFGLINGIDIVIHTFIIESFKYQPQGKFNRSRNYSKYLAYQNFFVAHYF